jgi:ectoine hydroxylase-related dioxygenase (phytanoyl-CoA dioxygenase family)
MPGSKQYVACHQDATFWGLSQPKGVTVWVALTPSNEDNGGMYVAPGTHLKQLRHFDTKDSLNMLGAGESVVNYPNQSQIKPLILLPGQMSFHHPLILHGSPSNQTQERRLAFVIRYIPAFVSQKGGTVTLVKGNNLSDMELESPPIKALSASLLQRHAQIIRQNANVIRVAKKAYFQSINKKNNESLYH